MDKFREDTANALIAYLHPLARWITASLPGNLLDSVSGKGAAVAADPPEAISTQLACLAEAIRFDETSLFLDGLAWVDSRRRDGQPSIEEYFATLQTAAENCLPDPLVAFIAPILQKAFATFVQSNRHVPSPLDRNAPFADAASAWLKLLLGQKTSEARKFVFESLASGLRPLDLFDFVFTPALREIGWLWQTRQIDEAHEHFCAAFTQIMVAVLSSEHAARPVPCSAVGFCVEGELHDVAIRMLCESLFMHGWDCNVYGANLPTSNVVSLVQRRQPNLIAMSVTMIGNLRSAQRSIAAIRAANLRTQPRILLGGRPFQICPRLVSKIGADGTAANCSDLISRFVSEAAA